MKKHAFVVFLAVILALASCGNNVTDGGTDVITTVTGQTETETGTETEAPETEELPPADDLSADTPTIDDNFTFAASYKEPATENSGTKRVKLDDKKLTFEYESTFYGSESFVKRDTHVFGYLYKMSRISVEFPLSQGYYFADFNGDRTDDMVTFDNGVLNASDLSIDADTTNLIKIFSGNNADSVKKKVSGVVKDKTLRRKMMSVGKKIAAVMSVTAAMPKRYNTASVEKWVQNYEKAIGMKL